MGAREPTGQLIGRQSRCSVAAPRHPHITYFLAHGISPDVLVVGYLSSLLYNCVADAMLQHGGFLGSDVFHDDAEETSDNSEFVVLFRFSSFWGMESWLASEERAHMLRRLEPMLSQPSTYREPTGQRYARSPGAITPAKDLFSDLVGPQVIFSSSLSLPLLSSSPSR